VTEGLLASQEGFCSVEPGSYIGVYTRQVSRTIKTSAWIYDMCCGWENCGRGDVEI